MAAPRRISRPVGPDRVPAAPSSFCRDIVSPMDCLTCEQLTAEFERAQQRYSEARAQLTACNETSNAKTYRAVKEYAEDARMEYEVTRIELERHQRTHQPKFTY